MSITRATSALDPALPDLPAAHIPTQGAGPCMSVTALRWAWKQSQVKGLTKLVLVRLADHADSSGQWNPSVAGLAYDCGISERSVQYALKDLKLRGFISVERLDHAKSVYTLTGANGAPLLHTMSTTGANGAPYLKQLEAKAEARGRRLERGIIKADVRRKHGIDIDA